MYFRLALGNVRRSLRDYAVYFVTIALGVAVFYAFNTISGQSNFLSESTNAILNMLSGVMMWLTVFLALVLGFLMVYANNFLIKRRKRELGLYQILGMTRTQVSRIIALETLIASVASFVAGILVGVLASQLLVFVTASLFHDAITKFSFVFSPFAFFLTLACLGMMFMVMLLFNLRTLAKVKLIDLMGADQRNEQIRVRSLPLSACLFVAGVALVVWAYLRLEAEGLPVSGPEGYMPFGITTLIVSVGTLLLFFGLSGMVLFLSKATKSHYYHGINMFTTRQLATRINSASASMGVICLILFLAITSVTGGMSICSMLNQNLENHTPYDMSVVLDYYDAEDVSNFSGSDDIQRATATRPANLEQILTDAGINVSSAGSSAQATIYWPNDGSGISIRDMANLTGLDMPAGVEDAYAAETGLYVIGQTDYNNLLQLLGKDPVDLGTDGYLLTCDAGDIVSGFYDQVCSLDTPLTVGGHALHPVQGSCVTGTAAVLQVSADGTGIGTLIVPDDVVAGMAPYQTILNMRYAGDTKTGDALAQQIKDTPDTSGTDTSSSNDNRLRAYEGSASTGVVSMTVTKTRCIQGIYGVTGIISYMAVYIGFVLVISCAAILAIQQLSGASDSAPRYRMLSELGCPRRLSNRSLLMQTLFYFLLPLALALAHSVVALRSVTKVVSLLGHLDITDAALSCGVLFVLVYGAYFVVTYLVARGVVNARTIEARN